LIRQRHVRGWTRRERGVLDLGAPKRAEVDDGHTFELIAYVKGRRSVPRRGLCRTGVGKAKRCAGRGRGHVADTIRADGVEERWSTGNTSAR
jgi:hypothetical protein